MTERFKPFAASLVILKKGNDILLLRRAGTGWGDGLYSLPSGHIEENETASAAAVRETLEEVGVEIDTSSLKHVHTLYRFNPETSKTYVDFFFVADAWKGDPYVAEPDKSDELQWVPIDSLPENTVPFVKDAVDQYLKGNSFSEVGW